MTARGWSAAIAASALLHGAGLAALALTIAPEPSEDQPLPQSLFSVEAAKVKRSQAEPQTPQNEPATEGKAAAERARQGDVSQTRATPRAPNATSIVSDPQTGTPLVALAPNGAAMRDVTEDKSNQITTFSLPATKTAPTLPTGTNLVPAPPSAPQASNIAPVTDLVGTTAATSPPADSLSLPVTQGTASLAWSGSDDATVSATSLAAIAAFTQAGDISAASAHVRDGISGILASVPCARLQTTFLPDTGQLELRGHLPEDALRAPVLAALREQVGDAISISDALLILPRPQCGALAGIAAVGLPQSTEQLTNPAVIGDDGFARNYAYSDGQRLTLDLTAPDYDAFIYIDYFAADGSVIHLQPNQIVSLTLSAAKSQLAVGRAIAGEPALEMTVSAPFGQEIAAAFAASVPLYDELRPLQEPAEPYLKFLKERVAQARADHPDFKGEWVYFFISTTAR